MVMDTHSEAADATIHPLTERMSVGIAAAKLYRPGRGVSFAFAAPLADLLPALPCRKCDPALDLGLRLREIKRRAILWVLARRQNRNNNPRSHRHPT